MKIDLKKLALYAEIIGGLAILISLIFVGVQLKKSTKATHSATASATVSTMANWYLTMGTDKESSKEFWQFLGNPEHMSKEEQLPHIYNLHGLLLTFQNSYYLVEEGTLDKRIRESLNQVIVAVKDQPGFHVFWNARKSIFFVEYREYVDAILESNNIPSEGIYKTRPNKSTNNLKK